MYSILFYSILFYVELTIIKHQRQPTDYQCHIMPCHTIMPIQQPTRHIQFLTKEKVSTEIQHLPQLYIIEKVSGPATWLNPTLPVINQMANYTVTGECYIISKLELNYIVPSTSAKYT